MTTRTWTLPSEPPVGTCVKLGRSLYERPTTASYGWLPRISQGPGTRGVSWLYILKLAQLANVVVEEVDVDSDTTRSGERPDRVHYYKLDELAEHTAALSQWIDSHPANQVSNEERMHRRVTKIYAEAGEVADAVSGWLGENPRKGRTHTRGDVVEELLDVALAALCAVEHLTANRGSAPALLVDKARRVHERALGGDPHAPEQVERTDSR